MKIDFDYVFSMIIVILMVIFALVIIIAFITNAVDHCENQCLEQSKLEYTERIIKCKEVCK